MSWAPSDDVVVVIGLFGPLDELAEITRSLIDVDQGTWDASPADAMSFDGCDSMFC